LVKKLLQRGEEDRNDPCDDCKCTAQWFQCSGVSGKQVDEDL